MHRGVGAESGRAVQRIRLHGSRHRPPQGGTASLDLLAARQAQNVGPTYGILQRRNQCQHIGFRDVLGPQPDVQETVHVGAVRDGGIAEQCALAIAEAYYREGLAALDGIADVQENFERGKAYLAWIERGGGQPLKY